MQRLDGTEPPQGLIREEFWKTKEDVEAVVMGSLFDLCRQWTGNLFKYGEMRGDMLKGDINQAGDERRSWKVTFILIMGCATGKISTR